jgi:hypothetical protein
MSDLKNIVRTALKQYGDGAAEHFGVAEGTLKGYIKKGKYPLKLVEQILSEQKENVALDEQKPEPVAPMEKFMEAQWRESDTTKRLEEVVRYIQGTVDFYIKQFAERIAALEASYMRHAGLSSLARPDQGVPVDQTYTTNPNTGVTSMGRHPLDTGIAPTKAQVDAQANMAIIEGVPVPGTQLAGPAKYNPDAPAFGFGWNTPRPPRK